MPPRKNKSATTSVDVPVPQPVVNLDSSSRLIAQGDVTDSTILTKEKKKGGRKKKIEEEVKTYQVNENKKEEVEEVKKEEEVKEDSNKRDPKIILQQLKDHQIRLAKIKHFAEVKEERRNKRFAFYKKRASETSLQTSKVISEKPYYIIDESKDGELKEKIKISYHLDNSTLKSANIYDILSIYLQKLHIDKTSNNHIISKESILPLSSNSKYFFSYFVAEFKNGITKLLPFIVKIDKYYNFKYLNKQHLEKDKKRKIDYFHQYFLSNVRTKINNLPFHEDMECKKDTSKISNIRQRLLYDESFLESSLNDYSLLNMIYIESDFTTYLKNTFTNIFDKSNTMSFHMVDIEYITQFYDFYISLYGSVNIKSFQFLWDIDNQNDINNMSTHNHILNFKKYVGFIKPYTHLNERKRDFTKSNDFKFCNLDKYLYTQDEIHDLKDMFPYKLENCLQYSFANYKNNDDIFSMFNIFHHSTKNKNNILKMFGDIPIAKNINLDKKIIFTNPNYRFMVYIFEPHIVYKYLTSYNNYFNDVDFTDNHTLQFDLMKTLSTEQLELLYAQFVKIPFFKPEVAKCKLFFSYLKDILQIFDLNHSKNVNELIHSFIDLFLQNKDKIEEIINELYKPIEYFNIHKIMVSGGTFKQDMVDHLNNSFTQSNKFIHIFTRDIDFLNQLSKEEVENIDYKYIHFLDILSKHYPIICEAVNMSNKQKHFAHDIYENTINRKDYLNKISMNDLISCINKIICDIELNNIHENIELSIITRLLCLYASNTLRLLDTKSITKGTIFKNYAVYFDNIPFNLQIDQNILNLVNGEDKNEINTESFENLSSTEEIDLLLSKDFKGVDGFENLLTLSNDVNKYNSNELLGYNDAILNTKYFGAGCDDTDNYKIKYFGADHGYTYSHNMNNHTYSSYSFFSPNMSQKQKHYNYNNPKFLSINKTSGEIIESTDHIFDNNKEERESYTIFIFYNKISKHCHVFKYNLQENSENIINKIIYDYFDIWFGNEFVFIETLKSSDIIVDFETVYNDFANRDFINRNEVLHRYDQCVKKYFPQKELPQEVSLKEVQLTIDQYCSIIRKYYNIDNNVENRVRSTELSISMIEKINEDLANSHQYVDEEHFISRFIEITNTLGLCKKRYAAGNYYYGISEKINIKQNTIFDTLNIKKEDCDFDPSKYESDVLKMIKNMELQLNEFKTLIKKNDEPINNPVPIKPNKTVIPNTNTNINPFVNKGFITSSITDDPIVSKIDIYPGMKLQPFILEQN
jgi:hypothetical protein